MSWTDPAVAVLEHLVAQGLTPGAVLAVRCGGVAEVRCTGALALDGPRAAQAVTPGTPFWLSSLSTPVAAVLAQAVIADGVLALDDEVARWVPELAAPRVLLDPAGPLAATEALHRPVTVRDVLSGTAGLGVVAEHLTDPPAPLFAALLERGVGPGPHAGDLDPDTWVARLAELPLAAQPGTRWLHHTPQDLLSVLLARATGRPLPELLAERVLDPLGLWSTGFALSGTTRDDVVDVLVPRAGGPPAVLPAPDPAAGTAFPGLAAGLLSTAADLLRFATALADGGAPALPPGAVAAMTAPVLTSAQRAGGAPFLEPGTSWGLGTGVDVACTPAVVRNRAWHSPGRWGWAGATGTALHVDPERDLVVVLLTGRFAGGPDGSPDDVWRALLGPLDDALGARAPQPPQQRQNGWPAGSA